MANTPTLSLRVHPDHHQLVRDVVARLKSDAGFADTLRTLLAPAGETVAVQAGTPDLLDLGRRLDAVERWIADHEANTVQAAPVQAGVSTASTSGATATPILAGGDLLVVQAEALAPPAVQAKPKPGRGKRGAGGPP